ncbi:hypothetical protein DFH06DRAFT_219233 [Mycena polygramma]|nr:hypothetical protein DFH06DRAFT_219233 [Mycena polygramma]
MMGPGVEMILNAIAAGNQAENARFDTLERKIAITTNRLEIVITPQFISHNLLKGTGTQIPYSEIRFLDGTRPTVATADRPALPLLSDADALRDLSGPDVTHYLTGYGIAPVPHQLQQRVVRIAQCIGCMVTM